jgi:hypothetical protein
VDQRRLSAPAPAGRPGGTAERRTRRQVLCGTAAGVGALGLAVLLDGCGPSKQATPGRGAAPEGSVAAVTAGLPQLSLLTAQSHLAVGEQLLTFGLSTSDNRLIANGQPQVWAARSANERARGPFPARWLELSAYKTESDQSGPPGLPGFYAAAVTLDRPGNWLFGATITVDGQRMAGQGALPVQTKVPAQPGTKALAIRSPVATTTAALKRICTRRPPDHLHAISLDNAIRSGKPTVVCFATPLLCESRMCAPVLDEVLAVHAQVNPGQANCIHVEEYLQPTHPDAPDQAHPSPTFRAWGFQTEPWTVIIDHAGMIRARFEGPVVASQLDQALRPLLR